MKVLLSLIIFISIIYAVWFFAVQFGSVNISTYKGDGKIKAIGAGFLSKGVEIELSVTDTREKIFSLNGLPVTGRDYYVMLQFPEKLKNKAAVTVKSMDKLNNILDEFMIKLESAQVISSDEKFKLYYNPEGYLHKDKIKLIDKLMINYSDADSINDIRIILRSGGSI